MWGGCLSVENIDFDIDPKSFFLACNWTFEASKHNASLIWLSIATSCDHVQSLKKTLLKVEMLSIEA